MKTRMADGSGSRHYRFTHENVDRHGNVRIYFWRGRGNPKIRLREKPGTPEFDTEYQNAFVGSAAATVKRGPAGSGSLRWLVEAYYGSPAFRSLDSTTQRVRRRLLDGLCELKTKEGPFVGSMPYRGVTAQHVAMIRDRKADTPEAANSVVKALRAVFKWACLPEYGYVSVNPAAPVGYLKAKNPDGHKTWTDDDVGKYETQHPIGTKARLALDLWLYTGVRISDVVRLGPAMEKDGKLNFTEFKGRKSNRPKHHALPILTPLRRSIDATPTGLHTYLVTETGVAYSTKGFGQWFKRRCKEAGIDPELSAHGLRKLAAVRCVEAGATGHELGAMFGWLSPKQIEIYTRMADRSKLEATAILRLLGNP